MPAKVYEIAGIMYDLGGPLVTTGEIPTSAVARYLGLSQERTDEIWNAHVKDFFTRKISERQWWEPFINEGKVKTTPEFVMKLFRSNFRGYDDNLALARRIKASGKYKSAILTDSPIEWLEYLRKRFNLDSCADMILSSQESGFMKSSPEAFKYGLANLKTEAAKTAFVDDKIDYVRVAKKTGLVGLHLKKPEDLRVLFERVGIKA